MEIKINVIEVASELADLAVRRELCDNEDLNECDGEWEKVYQNQKMMDGEVIICYTDKAQDLFNKIYDYYFNMLVDNQIN